MMAASLVSTPELMLNETESANLSEAIARVNELYDGFIIPEKQLAWINLGIVACSIYGPRAIAVSTRKKREKQQKPTLVEIGQQPGVTQ